MGGMGREMGGEFKREEIHVYLWLFLLRYDRKQQNSVKQLFFKKKKFFLRLGIMLYQPNNVVLVQDK